MTAEQRIAEVRELDKTATAGPWFDAYRCVHSKPLSDESIRLESLIPADAGTTHPAFAEWEAFPESDVCAVPAAGGDTPTEQGAKDAALIARYRTLALELADDLERAIAQRDSFRDHLAIAYQVIEELRTKLKGDQCP